METTASVKTKETVKPGQTVLEPINIDFTRLLSAPFGHALLGTELSADLYCTNGFRLAAMPAYAVEDDLEGATRKFRNTYKLDPEFALSLAIPTGYDQVASLADGLDSLLQLGDASHRIVCELFWPHIPEEVFQYIKTDLSLASPKALSLLDKLARSTNEWEQILAKHTLAIVHHNLAIAREIQFCQGKVAWNGSHWKMSLQCWGDVIRADCFWDYLSERIARFDHFRLKSSDIDILRERLPAVLLSFNTLFARAYADKGQTAFCHKHLAYVNNCSLPKSARREVLGSIIKVLVSNKLEPLVQRSREVLAEGSGKRSRVEFDRQWAPILEKAIAIRNYLIHELRIPMEMVNLSEFDDFCQVVLDGINTKIEYSDDDRQRSLLYSMVASNRLLGFPLSVGMRRKLEQSIRTDTGHLYDDLLLDDEGNSEFNPTECWFVEGQPADPTNSIVLHLFKISEVSVTRVAAHSSSLKTNCQWKSRVVLVPRSKLAGDFHRGKVKARELANATNNPACQALKSRLLKVREEMNQGIQKVEAEQDRALKASNMKGQQELDAFNATIANDEARAKKLVAEKRAAYDGQMVQEQAQCDDLCKDVERSYAAALDEAKKADEDASKSYGGLMRSFRKIALAVGQIIHRELVASPTSRTDEVLGLINKKKAEIVVKFEPRHKALNDAFLKSTSNARQWLETVEEKRTGHRNKFAAFNDNIRRSALTNIERIRSKWGAEIEGIERKLQASVSPKKEKDQKKFGPYKRAKSEGFKDGEKPSDSEINSRIRQEAARQGIEIA